MSEYLGAPDQLAVSMYLDELYASSDMNHENLVLYTMDRFNMGRTLTLQMYRTWLGTFPRQHLRRPGDLRAPTSKERR